MTIVTVLHTPDAVGGTERTAHLAAEELRSRGHRICLLQDRDSKVAAQYDSAVTIPDLFDRRARQGSGHADVLRFFSDVGAEIVHVHAYPTSRNLGWLARQRPTLTTVHVPLCPTGARYLWKPRCICERNVGMRCFTGGYLQDDCGRLGNGVQMTVPMFAKAMLLHRHLRSALMRCAGLVVPSEWMMQRLAKDGLPANRLHVVNPPIERPAMVASRLSVPPVILVVGRLVEVKGIRDLLRAVANLTLPHEVWIAGDGPDRTGLEAEIASLGIEARVRFLGNLSPKKVAELRHEATIAVMPSRWPETFGMSGPEAMAVGVPVVGYDAGAIGEWLIDGKNGRLVPLGDTALLASAIHELLSKAELRQKLSAGALALTERYSVAAHARRLEEIYDSLKAVACKQP